MKAGFVWKPWECRSCISDKTAARNRRVRGDARTEANEHYGPGCQCCGEQELVFLAVDHIDGNGAEHRRSIGTTELARWCKRNGWPSGFQMLCNNCNYAKWRLGVCPHEARRQTGEPSVGLNA